METQIMFKKNIVALVVMPWKLLFVQSATRVRNQKCQLVEACKKSLTVELN